MSGVILEPFTSIEAAERNFARLNEAVVALQGGSIAIENVEGYENLATKTDLAEAIETVQYAVGDIHITEDDSDPGQKFGYGEWTLISRGRALVGVDAEQSDDEADYEPDQDFQTVGQEGGEKTHTLTVDEIPSHDHNKLLGGWQADGNTPNNVNGIRGTGNKGERTEKTGGDQPHNIMQPYYCVYIWRRTA